jgi:hypothetical protein
LDYERWCDANRLGVECSLESGGVGKGMLHRNKDVAS